MKRSLTINRILRKWRNAKYIAVFIVTLILICMGNREPLTYIGFGASLVYWREYQRSKGNHGRFDPGVESIMQATVGIAALYSVIEWWL